MDHYSHQYIVIHFLATLPGMVTSISITKDGNTLQHTLSCID